MQKLTYTSRPALLRGLSTLTPRRLAFGSFTKARSAWRHDWCVWIICFRHNS
jgi:hypothetical protein